MNSICLACRVQSYAPFTSIAYGHLAELGIRNVEIAVPPADQLDAVRAELDRHGLRATTMHAECDIRRPDVGERVKSQLPAFEALGTRIMFVSVRADDTPAEVAGERLRQVGDLAAAAGITVALETHPDLMTNAAVALTTFRQVAHPAVRMNFDTANIYFYNQGVDCVAELRQVVGQVAAVHLKDTDGGYRHWHFPALGRGVVPFGEIFATLRDARFTGPCTLEIEGIEGEPKSERRICDRIAESLGYLRGLGVL